MKIGVISDMHLGHRQYGSLERENDFYDQYISCIQKMIKKGIDLLIISGDLFDKPNPSPKAMSVYRQGINLVEGIPVIVTKGNHTMLMRDKHYSVDNYFDDSDLENYRLLDDDFFIDPEENVVIQGMYYRSDSNLSDFIESQHLLAEDLDEEMFNILVVHQAFKEYCGFTGAELSLFDLDLEKINLVICGHIHSHAIGVIEDTIFLQPGSLERMNTTEAFDGQENGKGFWIVDTKKESAEFYPVDFQRDFLIGDIEFNSSEEIETHFELLKETLPKMNEPPIISYNYYDTSGNIVRLRELIKDNTKNCLINNSNVYDLSEEAISVEIEEGEIPTVLDVINKQDLEDNQKQLVKDIHSAYKDGLDDSVGGIIDTFFENNIKTEYKEDKSFEELDKEIQEYKEYFDNLGGNMDV